MDLTQEQKDKIIKNYVNNQKHKKIINKIRTNFYFFDDQVNLGDCVNISRGGSCSIGGLGSWSHEYSVYYNNQWTLQFYLVADENGSYGRYIDFGNKQTYLTGDLHNEEELIKFKKNLIEYSKIVIHNYNLAKKN